MQLGEVVGRVWATIKCRTLEGQRLLVVQPCNPDRKPTAPPIICADATGSAGAGELVYWCRGREASFAFLPGEVVVDNTIVGIVDELHVEPGEPERPC